MLKSVSTLGMVVHAVVPAPGEVKVNGSQSETGPRQECGALSKRKKKDLQQKGVESMA
jgi:hypothetical protein